MIFAEIDKKAFDLLPFVLNTVGEDEHQPPIVLPRGSIYHEFLWVTAGAADFSVGEEHFSLPAGEGVFMRAGVPHSYRGETLSTAWCTFVGGEGLLDYVGVGDFYRFSVPNFLSDDAAALYRLAVGDSTVLSRADAGYHLVSELLLATAAAKSTPAARVRSYLEQHYAEPLTLDDVAAVAGTDRFSLCHIYAKERGTTVMEDLLRIRIEKAKRLLRFYTMPVGQVGKSCGFSDASYFSLRFREICGCSPKEYRRKHDLSF